MSEESKCPLCKQHGANMQALRGASKVECQSCGTYAIDKVVASALDTDVGLSEQRYRISGVAREATLRGSKLLILAEEPCYDVPGFEGVLVQEVINGRFPRSLRTLLDRALLNLANRSGYPGIVLTLPYRTEYPLFFARNDLEAGFIGETLREAGLVCAQRDGPKDFRGLFLGLITAAGWNRVAELQVARVGEPLARAFVAMSFGNEENRVAGNASRAFLTDAFTSGFKVGIENAGYEARRIDFKEFNDDIMDEIIAEIRGSRFVVADFTGQRPGVYYEAGFARGLQLPVIFTCHKDDLAKAHFDTNHMNHIAWETPADLAKRLEKRIVATIGQGPVAVPRAAT